MALTPRTDIAGNPAPTDAQQAVAKMTSAIAATGLRKKPKLALRRGRDIGARWIKILFYGRGDTGKTYAIIGLLKAGLKVFVLSTDFGGSGLSTLGNYFKDHPEDDHLRDNIVELEINSYEEIVDFIRNPSAVPGFVEFAADILVWDGFSGFQQVHLAMHVSDEQEERNSKLSEAGLTLDQMDWGKVRNGTLWPLGVFLTIHGVNSDGTVRPVHKLVIAHEDAEKEDKLSGEKLKAPLLQGIAKTIVSNAFDVISNTTKKRGIGAEKTNYKYAYICGGKPNVLTKSRGYQLDDEEPGDMEKLWNKLATRFKPTPAAS